MARLSNFLRRHDDSEESTPATRECRLVQRHEIDQALRLLLSGPGGLARDEQVLDFLSYAVHRKIDVHGTWVSTMRGRIEWSLLPVVSPGRSMLILSPTKLFHRTSADALAALSRAVCQEYAQRDVQLAQLLLDPAQADVHDAYVAAGFSKLGELVYMHRVLRSTPDPVVLPRPLELRSFSPEIQPLFAQAIGASYENSLDCPGLNGIRSLDDVIDGHRATGEFHPSLWHIVLDHDRPIAVLLLNRSIQPDAMELVYIGLAHQARGRGIGDLLMRLAFDLMARDGKRELTLAVDALNAPAMRLYFRHGLKRVGSRTAMIRGLRPLRVTESSVTPQTIHIVR